MAQANHLALRESRKCRAGIGDNSQSSLLLASRCHHMQCNAQAHVRRPVKRRQDTHIDASEAVSLMSGSDAHDETTAASLSHATRRIRVAVPSAVV